MPNCAAGIEAVHRLDQSEDGDLDEVVQRLAAPQVPAGHGVRQWQVRLDRRGPDHHPVRIAGRQRGQLEHEGVRLDGGGRQHEAEPDAGGGYGGRNHRDGRDGRRDRPNAVYGPGIGVTTDGGRRRQGNGH
jgi:hypothetical protein